MHQRHRNLLPTLAKIPEPMMIPTMIAIPSSRVNFLRSFGGDERVGDGKSSRL